jgi:hypothetical protein
VLYSEELSFIPQKKKKKSSGLVGKIQIFTILLYAENEAKAFLPQIDLY